MKNLYLLFVLIITSFLSYGQTVLYTETFEQPSGADSIVSSGNPGWTINTSFAYEGVQSYHTVVAIGDTSYATTTQFSTTGNAFVIFSFAHIAKVSFFDAAIIQISFDNINWIRITDTNATYLGFGNFNQGTGYKFTAISYAAWQPQDNNIVPDNTWWKEETFDISNLAANKPQVWIRFKIYDGNNNGPDGNYGWLIDDIKVEGYICDPALTAGTASASKDSTCNLDPVTLTLAGYYGDIQWLVSTDGGSTWQVATGPGSNSDTLIVNPAQPTQYAAITSLGTCISDTSNILSIHVEQVVAPTTVGASRCGIGNITLNASGNGVLNWYADSIGSFSLDTGTTYTPYITATTTFYVSSTVGATGAPSTVEIGSGTSNSATLAGPTYISSATSTFVYSKHISIYTASEITAAGGGPGLLNQISWYKTNTNGYTGGDAQFDIYIKPVSFSQHAISPIVWANEIAGATLVYSSTTQNLNTTIGWQDFILDTPFYWNGSDNLEIFVDWFRPGSPTGAVNWAYTTTTNANSIRGASSPITDVTRNNNRPNIMFEFNAGGCESPRTPVTATVNPADAVSISASQVSLCEGETANLTASSNNAGYVYTWSPATGLNDSLGAAVTATPLTPTTYYVIGDDGTCANIDSVFIDVGPAAISGTATAPGDTVCTGNPMTLLLNGEQGNVQWWSSTDGINFQMETGAGSNSSSYEVTPLTNTYYYAVLSSAGCPEDTTNTLFVTSLSPIAPTVTNVTRCGYGEVTVQASGNGTIHWYPDTSSLVPLGTGNNFTDTIISTTTYYAANIVGGNVGVGEITIGTGTLTSATTAGPTYVSSATSTFVYSKHISIYTATEILAAGGVPGVISQISWYKTNTNGYTGGDADFDIYIKGVSFNQHAATPVNWASEVAGATLVYSSTTQNLNTSIGWQDFMFTTPFYWNGSDNLEIFVDWFRPGNATGAVSWEYTTTTNANAITGGTAPGTTATSNNNRPNIKLDFSGGGCSSPRVPVTATVTPPPPISISASTTSICLGDTAILTVSSPNSAYSYTWSPAAGLNTTVGATVIATPTIPTNYFVYANDGVCGNLDSVFINYGVSSAANPITFGDTICGPGTANLTAQGSGNLFWFETPTGGIPVGTGNTFSPNLTQTDTFFVQTLVGGDFFNVGPVNSGFGNQSSLSTANWGLAFNVLTTSTLDRVYIYPWATGSVTINMTDAGGTILQTTTVGVTAFTGKTPVELGWQLIPGTGYRLVLGSGSVALGRNTTNAAYPYSVPNGPVTITGYVNPSPGTLTTNYFYFYDWLVSTGCKSNRIPVTGVVLSLPPVPTISQVGNTLVSSSSVNNQWYFNGNPIPGATAQTYTPTQQGPYYVLVGGNSCFQLSNTLFFIPIGINEPEYIALNIYPNPGAGIFNIEFASLEGKDAEIFICNVIGERVYFEQIMKLSGSHTTQVNLSEHASGLYFLMIKCGEAKYFQKLIIAK